MCTRQTSGWPRQVVTSAATGRSLAPRRSVPTLDYVSTIRPTRTRRSGAGWPLRGGRRAKEAVYFRIRDLRAERPREFRRLKRPRMQPIGDRAPARRLARLLESRGLYRSIDGCLADASPRRVGAAWGEAEIDDVLMGAARPLPGSTRFRGSVRLACGHGSPRSGGYGAGVFAAGRVDPADFIVHEIRVAHLRPEDQAAQPHRDRSARTCFPTAGFSGSDSWCPRARWATGESLQAGDCEIAEGAPVEFAWDADGQLHRLVRRREDDSLV